MKKQAIIALAAALALPVAAETVTRKVVVENPLKAVRTDAPVVLPVANLNVPFEVRSVVVKIDGTEVPSQLDDLDRDNVFEEIALVADFAPAQKRELTLELSSDYSDKTYPARTFAQMMVRGRKNPEQIQDISVGPEVQSYSLLHGHGIMFESELNGYRIYFDPKQTLDPYGKFQRRLELEESRFYPNDDMLARGFGDDVLLVGQSLGIGALKGWDGTKATHVEPIRRRSQHVLAKGPVRAVVLVQDDGWNYDGNELNMKQTYTQWAGHRDVNIDVDFSRPLPENVRFATGVMNVKGNETLHKYGPEGTVASWGRHWPVNDTVKYAKERIGIATYVPENIVVDKAEDPDGFYYIISAPGSDHFSYSTMFTSGKETFGYETPQQWFAILAPWKRTLDNPLIITYLD